MSLVVRPANKLPVARIPLKRYINCMILSFGDKATEDFYNGIVSKDSRKIPRTIHSVAFRKLDMINSAQVLTDLKSPPANHLESLKGNLKGFFSIRINDQYRVVFKMSQSNVAEARIVDYH